MDEQKLEQLLERSTIQEPSHSESLFEVGPSQPGGDGSYLQRPAIRSGLHHARAANGLGNN